MKNLILTTAMAFLMILSVNAQNSSLILGINGGSNLSKLSYTGDYSTANESNSRTLGFQGGVDLGFKYNNFSILTGLKYIQRGGNTELKMNDVNNPFVFENGTTDTGVYTLENSYTNLSIPILFRYQTAGDLAFSITLGPAINMGIGDVTSVERYDFDNLNDIGPSEFKSTFGDQPTNLIAKSKVGFVFSPGILYKVSDSGYFRANFTIDSGGNIVNPTHGVSDNAGNGYNFSGSIKSSTITFEIGYEHRIDFTMGAKY